MMAKYRKKTTEKIHNLWNFKKYSERMIKIMNELIFIEYCTVLHWYPNFEVMLTNQKI